MSEYSLLFVLLSGVVQVAMGQQTDTSQTEKKELKTHTVSQPYHSERSPHGFALPESGGYDVPEPTKYYKPPFEGQKSLDRAVEAYREEIKNSLGNTPFFQFLKTIAPFINNRFEFGVYKINDLPITGRDNPYLYPQVGSDKSGKKEE